MSKSETGLVASINKKLTLSYLSKFNPDSLQIQGQYTHKHYNNRLGMLIKAAERRTTVI